MLGYETCWVEVSFPGQNKPLLFCSFYRNIQKHCVISEEEEKEEKEEESQTSSDFNTNSNVFNLSEFKKELAAARNISEHIIIGGDWNAHHPAWLDKNVDCIGEAVFEFINSNNLYILNKYPYELHILQ